ncbi:MAG: ribosome silencing factor [Syntrophobacteraceae bacterium]|nr:ribosome silencing factor [Syntrophobacteraceae bacterium]
MITVRKAFKPNPDPGRVRKDLPGLEKAILCVQEVQRYRAQDPVLLEVSHLSSFADYFIVCSGRSSRQVQSIAENLEMILEGHGIRPLGVEGRQEGHWVLMDYGDVIVHVFYEPVRRFYDLESLWSEARRIRTDTDPGSDAAESVLFDPT